MPPAKKSTAASPSPSRVTLRQVALAAGVSAMTVSRAFRNDGVIRPAMRERIHRLAAKLGYAPDPHISSVMRAFARQTRPDYRETIAFIGEVVPVPKTFEARFLNGARERAESLGYRIDPFWLQSQRVSFSRLSRQLRNRNVRGLILCPFGNQPHMHARLNWAHFAAVAVGSSLWKPRINRVQHHHYMGMILALRSLRRRIRGKVGLIISTQLHARTQGAYVSSFLTNQSGSSRDLLARVHRYAAWNEAAFRDWMSRTEPKVILCSQIDEAEQVEAILKKSGAPIGLACLNVPVDLPHLAGIDQHNEVIGSHALDLVLTELRHSEFGLPEHPKTLMIEGSWREGTSLDAVANRGD